MLNEGHIEARSHIEACPRRIIHIDMDAFYAAVEQRDRPELRGRPVAIGSASDRGVVLTTREQAKKLLREQLTGPSLVDELVADRREAAHRDDTA